MAGWAGSWLIFGGSSHLAALRGLAGGTVAMAIVAGNIDRLIDTLSKELRQNAGEIVSLLPLPASAASIERRNSSVAENRAAQHQALAEKRPRGDPKTAGVRDGWGHGSMGAPA